MSGSVAARRRTGGLSERGESPRRSGEAGVLELAVLGFVTIGVFLALILFTRTPVLAALVLVLSLIHI